MFVQVIQGEVKDPDGLRASLDRWIEDLGPGAEGWLGTTWGMYGTNSFIALARFESAEAAKETASDPSKVTGGPTSRRRSTARHDSPTTTTSSSSAPADPTMLVSCR